MPKLTQLGIRSRSTLVSSLLFYGLIQMGMLILNHYYPSEPERTPASIVRTRRFYSTLQGRPTFEHSIIQWQTRHALSLKQRLDVLFLGDSSCLMGVKPSSIHSESGLQSWNIGTIGFLSTAGHSELFDLVSSNSQVPPVAVYHVTGATLIQNVETIDRMGYLKLFRKWMGLTKSEFFMEEMFSQLPTAWLASRYENYLENQNERRNLDYFLNSQRGIYPSDNQVAVLLKRQRGWLEEVNRAPLRVDSDPIAKPRLDPDAIAGLRALVERSAKAGMKLAIVANPVAEQFRSAETEMAYAKLERDLSSLSANFGHVTVQSPLLQYYPDKLFGTCTHLTAEGAERHSRELARWIKAGYFSKGTFNNVNKEIEQN